MKFLSSLTKKDLQNKICLLWVDLNIQNIDLRGYQRGFTRKIPFRLEAVLPTIKFLIKNGAKVVILSHRGRPQKVQSSKLKVQSYKQFSLKPFAKILSFLLKTPVRFVGFDFLSLRGVPQSGTTKQSQRDCHGLRPRNDPSGWIASPSARNDIGGQFRNSISSSIFLLENLRFFDGEEENSDKFAKKLASLGDFYVNDAFSVCHRANASVAAITKFLPSYVGLLLKKEIKSLDKAIKNSKKPLVVILGGAKISDKIGAIKNFLKKVKGQKSKANCILVGGGMANTFLAVQGLPVGDSLYDADLRGQICGLTRTKEFRQKVILPTDTVVYKRQILDIGPKTIEKYSKIIENAKTIIWNGPMGYIEDKKFRKGSEAIARAIIKSKAFSIIGGGETTPIVSNVKCQMSNVFLSTGGGAMLEYLAGKKLPGLTALE